MKRGVVAVVPARLGSRRFPRKVLHSFHDKPLIYYPLSEIKKARTVDRLLVATDSAEVETALAEYGFEVIRTSSRHRTGSDRVAEAVSEIGGDIVVNVQADNFGLKATAIDRAVSRFKADRGAEYATLSKSVGSDDELSDPNVVKMVVSRDGRALWFSRLPVPFLQNGDDKKKTDQFKFLHHVGVYLFRRKALERFAAWRRTPAEKAESLEQLRILEHGEAISVYRTRAGSISVDCPEDLEKIETLYK